MPTYTFRCDSCDEFTAVLPMSELRPTQPCPRCARESRRVYGVAPALLSTPAGLRRRIEAAAASAEAPQVARSIPACAPLPPTQRRNPFTGPRPVEGTHRP